MQGYKIYLNDFLYIDASTKSTLNAYTFTNLSVGKNYKISITAINQIGESAKTSLTVLAASVPPKMSAPTL